VDVLSSASLVCLFLVSDLISRYQEEGNLMAQTWIQTAGEN